MSSFSNEQSFQFGEQVYDAGGRYGPLNYEHLNLSYLLCGEVIIISDGEVHRFTAGQSIFIYNRKGFEVIYPDGCKHHAMWCHTGETRIRPETWTRFRSLPKVLPPSELLLTLLKAGIGLGHEAQLGVARVRNLLGAAVYSEYFRQAHLDDGGDAIPKAVMIAKRYLEQHVTDDFNLDKIGAIAALNSRYLLQLFKKHLGITPARYLWHLRADLGVQLLKESDLGVSPIAYRCGFRTSYHFSRYIKQHYGCTPTELRTGSAAAATADGTGASGASTESALNTPRSTAEPRSPR